MVDPDLYKQLGIERDLLTHVLGALKSIIQWQVEGSDVAQKLNSLRFISKSLQRHLDRLISLERCVEWDDPADDQEHFRAEVGDLVRRFEVLSPADEIAIEDVCDQLLVLLAELERFVSKLVIA